MTALRDAALRYAEQGLAVFPVKPRGKEPLTARGFLDATTDLDQVRAWWTQHPTANVGAVPASVGLLALDVDTPAHESIAQSLGLFAEPTHTTTTGNGRHLWFRHDAPDATTLAGIIARAGRGYVLMPPSVHPSGAVYSSETTLADAIPLPPAAVAALTATPAPRAVAVTSGKIGPGDRHTALVSEAGRLAAHGHTGDDGHALLQGFNLFRCQPPKDAEEVSQVWAWTIARETAKRAQKTAGLAAVDLSAIELPVTVGAPGNAAGAQTGRTIFTPSELMREPETVPFLVDNVLVKAGLACGWGPSGCGKTFVLFDLALHVAAGLPWLGRNVERGDVLYVAAEGFQGLRSRLAAWCEEHELAPADLDGLVAIRRGAWAITDAQACAFVLEEVRAHALTPALIVLDTLSANAPTGFKESGTEDMKTLMDAGRALRDATGATVLFVHHTGLDQSRMRGSTDLYAALDVSLGIKRVGDTARRITFDKARDFAAPEPIECDLVPRGGSLVVRAVSGGAPAVQSPDPRHVELLTVLQRAGRPLAFMEWLRGADGWTKTPFNKLRAELAHAQYIVYSERGYTLSTAGRALLAAIGSEPVSETESEPEPSDPQRFGFTPLSTDRGETEPNRDRVDMSGLGIGRAA